MTTKMFLRACEILPIAMVAATLALAACSDRKPAASSSPAPTSVPPANTSTPSSSNAPVIAPGTGSDVTKKGTSTGMIGGEAGTVASSGKPGTGTDSGAGTGASQASDSKTSDKK